MNTKNILLLTIKNSPELICFFDLNNRKKSEMNSNYSEDKYSDENEKSDSSEHEKWGGQNEFSNKRISFSGAVIVFSIQINSNIEGKKE